MKKGGLFSLILAFLTLGGPTLALGCGEGTVLVRTSVPPPREDFGSIRQFTQMAFNGRDLVAICDLDPESLNRWQENVFPGGRPNRLSADFLLYTGERSQEYGTICFRITNGSGRTMYNCLSRNSVDHVIRYDRARGRDPRVDFLQWQSNPE